MLPLRTMSAAVASMSVLGVAVPVAGAVATTAPVTPVPPLPAPSPLLTFVPPKVGPISVYIGPTIISGKVISPGLYVRLPGFSLPPISWTPLLVPSTR